MFKFLRSLIIWQVVRNNMPIVKKCFIALAIILISFYFFPDWESYFEKKNSLDMLLYTKLAKYAVLIYAAFLFFSNVKRLSILGKREKENPSPQEDKKLKINSVVENLDPDLEILRNKPEIITKSERIKEKYSQGKLDE